jgi:hypothetical protein
MPFRNLDYFMNYFPIAVMIMISIMLDLHVIIKY